MKRVTCITTAYRKFEHIYETIDSVLLQEYPNIEFILCDDGSDNFPEGEIKRYVEQHNRGNLTNVVIYSNEVNLGIIRNFNRAISKSTGDYFIGVSSDDLFYDSHVISRAVECFERTGAKIATCKAVLISPDPKMNGKLYQTKRNLAHLRGDSPPRLYNKIAKNNIILGASTFYTRELLNKYGQFDEAYTYVEDWSRYLNLLRNNEKIFLFDFISTYYRVGGISNGGNMPVRYLEDILKICETEILKNKDASSCFAYRYNLCRRASLRSRMENKWGMMDKLRLLFRYPDAILYNLWIKLDDRFGRETIE